MREKGQTVQTRTIAKKSIKVATSLVATFFFAGQVWAADDVNVTVNNQQYNPEPPLVVVPQNYQGTVEIMMTPSGYMVRTLKNDISPYPAIKEHLRRSENFNQENDNPKYPPKK